MSERLEYRMVDPREDTAVERVVDDAFGSTVEYGLIAALREDPEAWVPEWSLGAYSGGSLVGHVLFTRASVGGLQAALLAPLAVAPAWQRRGVGEGVSRAGLEAARLAGAKLALVLGHPRYYPRLGFVPAYPHAILPPYEVNPREAWMVMELVPGALEIARGTVSVAEAFMQPEMWRED